MNDDRDDVKPPMVARPVALWAKNVIRAGGGNRAAIGTDLGGTGDVLLPVTRKGYVARPADDQFPVRRGTGLPATTDETFPDDTTNDAHVIANDDYLDQRVEDQWDLDRAETPDGQTTVVPETVRNSDERLLQLVHLDLATLETAPTDWQLVLPRRINRRRVSAMPTLQTGATVPVFMIWLGDLPPQVPFPTTSAAIHRSAIKLLSTGGQQHFHAVTDRAVWCRAMIASGSTGWLDVWEESL